MNRYIFTNSKISTGDPSNFKEVYINNPMEKGKEIDSILNGMYV